MSSPDNIAIQLKALELMSRAVAVANKEGALLWANKAFYDYNDKHGVDCRGSQYRVFESDNGRPGLFHEMEQMLIAGREWNGILTRQSGRGGYTIEQQILLPLMDKEGQLEYIIVFCEDVTEREAVTADLRRSEFAYRRIQEIASDPHLSFDQKVEGLLHVGTDFLGLPIGMLGDIEEGVCTVTHYSGPTEEVFTKGATIRLGREPWDRIDLSKELIFWSAPAPVTNLPDSTTRQVHDFVAAPISVLDERWGVLCFYSRLPGRPEFSPSDRTFLRLIAQWVEHELERRARERREIQTARRIQSVLLEGTNHRYFPGLDLAAVTLPSQEVDGDFYDLIEHDQDCLDIVVGDVMGKGVPAALLGAAAKSILMRVLFSLQACSADDNLPSIAGILNSLHAALVQNLVNLNAFITFFYFRYDPVSHLAEYSNCGHSPGILYRKREGKCELIGEDGFPPFGLSSREIYTASSFEAQKGDVLVLYSDGISEAASPDGELYGVNRLCDTIERNADDTTEGLLHTILCEVREFSRTPHEIASGVHDDVTCLVAKFVHPLSEQELEKSVVLPCTEEGLTVIRETLLAVIGDCQPRFKNDLVLALHECATNIVRHAIFSEGEDRLLTLDIIRYKLGIQIVLSYPGEPFVSLQPNLPRFDRDQTSGYGLHIAIKCTNRVACSRTEDGRNQLLIVKFFDELR